MLLGTHPILEESFDRNPAEGICARDRGWIEDPELLMYYSNIPGALSPLMTMAHRLPWINHAQFSRCNKSPFIQLPRICTYPCCEFTIMGLSPESCKLLGIMEHPEDTQPRAVLSHRFLVNVCWANVVGEGSSLAKRQTECTPWDDTFSCSLPISEVWCFPNSAVLQSL